MFPPWTPFFSFRRISVRYASAGKARLRRQPRLILAAPAAPGQPPTRAALRNNEAKVSRRRRSGSCPAELVGTYVTVETYLIDALRTSWA